MTNDAFISLGAAAARVVDNLREPRLERIAILNKQHWLDLRMHDITASDVPAVCGEGKYGSAAKVWATKRGLLPPTEETARMRAGRWYEPAVFEAMAELYPNLEVRRAKVYLRDAAARLGATPDAVAIDPERSGFGVIEAKNVLPQVFVADWCGGNGDDGAPAQPPIAYQLQTLTQAMLAGADWAVIAVLINNPYNPTLRLFPVERHAGAEAMIRDHVAAFWRDYLDLGVCPPLDPERDDELVKRLFPRDDGSEIDLTTDNRIVELVDNLAGTKAELKHLDKRKTAIETEIKDKLGPAAYGRIPDGRIISWKSVDRAGYTVAPSSFRVLHVSKGG